VILVLKSRVDAQLYESFGNVNSTAEANHKFSRLFISDMIYQNQQCQVLMLKDINKSVQNHRLKREKEMANFLCQSISHEMITPLRCITDIVGQVIDNLGNESSEIYSLKIISNTAQILLSFIKTNMDEVLLEANKFTPVFEQYSLIEEVIKPSIDIFIVQAQMNSTELNLTTNLQSD
jgi:K+-sensing histidine kinase KdpD